MLIERTNKRTNARETKKKKKNPLKYACKNDNRDISPVFFSS